MGQHKLTNRLKLATRWILCTKWAKEDRNTKEAYVFWTPIGIRRGTSGMPLSYATQDEATLALKQMIEDEPKLASGVLYTALEVKYVPNKIRAYDEDWFKKYCKKEVTLQVTKEENVNDVITG